MAEAGDRVRLFDPAVDDIEIPRPSRPFRAWTAAQGYRDGGPSLWERFRQWLAGLFGRKQTEDRDEMEQVSEASDEQMDSSPKRPSFDDLDAPWGEPHEGGETPSRRKSAELPHPDDFEPPWDDPYAGHEKDEAVDSHPADHAPSASSWSDPAVPSAPPPDGPADPLWDEPRVAASTKAPAEVVDRRDLDFVWTPPGPDDVDLLAEARNAAAAAEAGMAPHPKRLSFISKLFSRKKKAPEDVGADDMAAMLGEVGVEEHVSAREPAVDDFASERAAERLDEPPRAPRGVTPSDLDATDRAEEEAVAQAAGDFDVDVEVDVDAVAEPAVVEADTASEAEAALGVELVEEEKVSPPPPSRPDRPSLIARLFGRKSKDSPKVVTEIDAAIADLDVIEEKLEPAEETPTALSEPDLEESGREPAVDEPTIQAARRPSLAHSAEDAAQLANFLAAPFAPVDGAAAEPEGGSEVWPEVEPEVELEVGSEVWPEVEPEVGLEVGPEVEPEVVAEAEPEPEPEPEAEPEPDVAPQSVLKKPGFFSRLMWRRSQAKPPVIEPEEPPVEEVVAETEVAEEASPDLDSTAEVEQQISDADIARWARPAAREAPAETADDLATTLPPSQPLVPFVDARDDFRDEVTEAATPSEESGRITEAFEQPIVDPFDEGEKTDEFEVVPGTPEMAETAALSEAPPGFFARLLGRKKATTGETTGAGTVAKPLDVEGKAPFVLAKFRMFYNEVIRDKHTKSDVIAGFATAIVSAAAADMADPEFAAQLLAKRLSEMLELQAAESNWTGGDAVKYYPEAQYAMVALADETFLTIDWPGRPSWHKYMLEPRMFQTRGAGTELFRRIDKLLREPDPPQGARDLARVYLLVIASGFRGMFREPGLKRPLAEYRRRLYEFSHLADPLELYARDRRIFPEAAEQTLASRAVGRFTAAQKWIAAVIILIVLYGTVSHLAWTKLSADLKDVMARIESSTGHGGTTR